jgi:hypothetical protein
MRNPFAIRPVQGSIHIETRRLHTHLKMLGDYWVLNNAHRYEKYLRLLRFYRKLEARGKEYF